MSQYLAITLEAEKIYDHLGSYDVVGFEGHKSQRYDIKGIRGDLWSSDSERAHQDASNAVSPVEIGPDMDENEGNH